MQRDLLNNIHTQVALAPVVATNATVLTTSTIDTLGYNSLVFATLLGTIAGTGVTGTVQVFDGDVSDMSDEAVVAANELVGTLSLAGFIQTDDGESRKIGYVGNKRYVRMKITPTGNNANLPIAVLAILGHPNSLPTANPPQ